jgi:hypothetical protein
MSVTSLVSESGILELERQAVDSYRSAQKGAAEFLEILWAIKEGDHWKGHMIVDENGKTQPAFTNFATGYLPHFLEFHEIGRKRASWVLAKFRLYQMAIDRGAATTFPEVLEIENQYTVENYVKQLEAQGEGGKQAASDLLRQAVEGTIDINSLQQEAGLFSIRYVTPVNTKQLWVRVPDDGDYMLDAKHFSDRAWMSLVHKTKAITVETGEGYE